MFGLTIEIIVYAVRPSGHKLKEMALQVSTENDAAAIQRIRDVVLGELVIEPVRSSYLKHPEHFGGRKR